MSKRLCFHVVSHKKDFSLLLRSDNNKIIMFLPEHQRRSSISKNPREATSERRFLRVFWLSLLTLCMLIGLNLFHRIAKNFKLSSNKSKENEGSRLSTRDTLDEGEIGTVINLDRSRIEPQLSETISEEKMPTNVNRLEETQPVILSSRNADFRVDQSNPEYNAKTGGDNRIATVENRVEDDSVITSGIVQIQLGVGNEAERTIEMPYYHCGPFYTLGANQGNFFVYMNYFGEENGEGKTKEETKIFHEFLFLHGATYTKEDWKTSGILDKMCSRSPEDVESHTYYSVTAVDISVYSDGLILAKAFDALTESGIISGLPLVIVSPSASGIGVLDLASIAKQPVEIPSSEEPLSKKYAHLSLLETIMMAWIPIACYDVNIAKESIFGGFKTHFSILAIHGSSDVRGRASADRLEQLAGAKKLVVGKNHACYLDEPDRFVAAVKSILKPEIVE